MVCATSGSGIGQDPRIEPLLSSLVVGNVHLRNRFVMAPMTRRFSPGGVPGGDVAEYYRRRAAGGTGMLITEGAFIPHDAAGDSDAVPALEGNTAARGWRRVVDAVHSEGSQIYCQLWHQGIARADLEVSRNPGVESVGPTSIALDGREGAGHALTHSEIDALVSAYAQAALFSKAVGFDGLELHGAHGYLLDQFLWTRTNRRADCYAQPMLFPRLVVEAVRDTVGPSFPIAFRFSQWKVRNYDVLHWDTPSQFEPVITTLVEAGVDILHPSTRRFWEPAFPGSDPELTLAGWTKRISGLPTIAVGSVGLDRVFADDRYAAGRASAHSSSLDRLIQFFARGEFDLVAIGRALLSEPEFVNKHAQGRATEIRAFEPRFREQLD